MTSLNQLRYAQARDALKAIGMEPKDFIELDMAMCFKTWEDDLGPMNMTPEDAMEMQEEYFVDLVTKALVSWGSSMILGLAILLASILISL